MTVPGCMPFAVAADACAVGEGATAAAGGAASCRRNSTQPRASTLTPNNTPSAAAHPGNRRRGAATFTSNSAGDAWRWRSLSDFFRASRMKDMSAPGLVAQERRGRIVECRVERHLGLHAGDAIHGEAIPALEIFNQRDERRVVAIARGLFGG